MTDKTFCSFYNVGYCKYKDKCSNEHAKSDCEDKKCIREHCHKRHRKFCKNGLGCKFNSKNKCEFKHDHKAQTDNNVETSELLSQTKLLSLEITDLNASNEQKVMELANLQNELQQIKVASLETENNLKAEVVKLKNNIKEVQMKSNLQNNDFEIEIKAKNKFISALQKSLKEISLKHEKSLVDHKKELSEKDNEFGVLLNNLNNMNKQNHFRMLSPEEEAFPCRTCDKQFASKEFLESHIQTLHASLGYNNKGILKCRICGKEFNTRKLLDNHIVVKH